jgi:hypothetical protein
MTQNHTSVRHSCVTHSDSEIEPGTVHSDEDALRLGFRYLEAFGSLANHSGVMLIRVVFIFRRKTFHLRFIGLKTSFSFEKTPSAPPVCFFAICSS